MTPPMSRRQALGTFGSVSLGALLAACGEESPSRTTSATPSPAATETARETRELVDLFDASASCRKAVELTEGPYYFDADAIRSDIRENREGVTLRLGIRVRDAGRCEPIRNAIVDIWHCDAVGAYSGFTEEGRFLRGTQPTVAGGIAQFTTIYPGWYQGRAVHIHAKVHLDSRTVLTSQLFFDDAVSETVFQREPYSAKGPADQTNDSDGIFDPSLVLTLREEEDGYLGLMTFDVVT